jgi:hypothetical protein
VVGLYEGQYPPGVQHSGDFHPQGAAWVKVTYTAAPVILVLCAYEPVKWHVEAAKDVRIASVILSGYHWQELAGLPAETSVLQLAREANAGAWFFAYKKDREYDAGLAAKVRKVTNREIVTFQGMYAFQGQPLLVGPESAEWRTQHILWRLVTWRSASRTPPPSGSAPARP